MNRGFTESFSEDGRQNLLFGVFGLKKKKRST